jgi:hypothetical protein
VTTGKKSKPRKKTLAALARIRVRIYTSIEKEGNTVFGITSSICQVHPNFASKPRRPPHMNAREQYTVNDKQK